MSLPKIANAYNELNIHKNSTSTQIHIINLIISIFNEGHNKVKSMTTTCLHTCSHAIVYGSKRVVFANQ